MKYYLSIDGGGTKTKFLLTDTKGRKIVESIQPASHYLQCGLDGVTRIMSEGLSACLNTSHIHTEDIKQIFVACAGYNDIKDDSIPIEHAVYNAFKDITHTVGNDTDNALAGALAGKPGINIIAGTGSIGLGKAPLGNTMRCGGWNHQFGGDEGSGNWMGARLILAYTRQCDGRDKKTELYYYINKKYGFTSDSDFLKLFVIDWGYDRTKIASLAKDVQELAELDDPHALQIFNDAARELNDIILAVKRSLQFDTIVKVSYTGGVFKSGRLILDPLARLLEGEGVELCPPILLPDSGGIIIAMQQDGVQISDEIITNLQRENNTKV